MATDSVTGSSDKFSPSQVTGYPVFAGEESRGLLRLHRDASFAEARRAGRELVEAEAYLEEAQREIARLSGLLAESLPAGDPECGR